MLERPGLLLDLPHERGAVFLDSKPHPASRVLTAV